MNSSSVIAVVLMTVAVAMVTGVVTLAIVCRRGKPDSKGCSSWPCRFAATDRRAARWIVAALAAAAVLATVAVLITICGSAR